MNEVRKETDSMGVVEVPADKLWGRRRSARWSISVSAGILSRGR
jgi:fumarate hydratase class II